MTRTPSRQSGLSLVELLIAFAVFSLFLIGLLTAYAALYRSYASGQSKIETQQSLRVAIEMITREARMAGYDPSGAIPLQAVASAVQLGEIDHFTYLADVDGDDVTDQISYSLASGELLREFSSWDGAAFPAPSSMVMARGITALGFRYFDGAAPTNNELAAPVANADLDDVRRVVMDVAATDSRLGGAEQSFPVSMDVQFRNLP